MIDSLLDRLPDDEAATILQRLIDPPRRWTLLLATNRRYLAAMLDGCWDLSSLAIASDDHR